MRVSLISAALVAALVGYGSTIALVLAAAAAVGADAGADRKLGLGDLPGQGGWAAPCCGLVRRVPVVLAWSTPGAALIAATSGITHARGGRGLRAGGGADRADRGGAPAGARWSRAIPDGIAAAMLAGVLLPFC